MATVSQVWPAVAGDVRSVNFPGLYRLDTGSASVQGYAFDPSAQETLWFRTTALRYGGGSVTVWLDWYAATATSGAVQWLCNVAAITPNTDTQDVETDTLQPGPTVTTSHLGGTGHRMHRSTVTIPTGNLDGLTANDNLVVVVSRNAANAADTMAGDAILTTVTLNWSDT